MKIGLIERDIRNLETALNRCNGVLGSYILKKSTNAQKRKDKETLDLLSYEKFFLQDQLDKYYTLRSILVEEQAPREEMLQKV